MRKVQGSDSFQRINYLYQISKEIVGKNPELSAYYNNLVINIAKRSVLKIHPDIKRQICKKCRCMLVDQKSSKMKLKTRQKQKFIEIKCTLCGHQRKFLSDKNKDHRVWVEKPEAVVEVIT